MMARTRLKGLRGIRVFLAEVEELRGFSSAHGFIVEPRNKPADGAEAAFPGVNKGVNYMLTNTRPGELKLRFWSENEYLLLSGGPDFQEHLRPHVDPQIPPIHPQTEVKGHASLCQSFTEGRCRSVRWSVCVCLRAFVGAVVNAVRRFMY